MTSLFKAHQPSSRQAAPSYQARLRSRRLSSCALAALLCLGLSASAQAQGWRASQLEGAVYRVEDLTRGLRFDPPLTSIAQSGVDPSLLFVGTHNGRVYVSQDGGDSWVEDAIRTDRVKFLGAQHRHVSRLKLDPPPFLKGDISPSPGQVFSFQELIDLNRQLPQASWIIQRRFDRDVEGGLRPMGFMSHHGHARGSWRLQSAIARSGGYEIGVSWRDWVSDKSVEDQAVKQLAPHPRYAEVVFASTEGGLHRSTDRGDSWPLIVSGGNKAARSISYVAVSPRDPLELWIGTRQGLKVSQDGGETLNIPTNPLAAESEIRWISFHPKDPQTVYVALSWGMLKTSDGGASFGVIYYNSWPALSSVRRVLIDPYKPNRVLVGTDDGLMLSEDDGESFERVGGLLFMEKQITAVIQGFAPGHHFAATRSDVWQTFDGGRTWRSAYFGDGPWRIQNLIRSRGRERSLWLLTEGEILKLTAQAPERIDPSLMSEITDREHREPSVTELVEGALKRAGIHPSELHELLRSAPLGQLLPRLELRFAQRSAPIGFQVNNYLIGSELTNFNEASFDDQTFAAYAWWDLAKLLYHPQELSRPASVKASLKLSRELHAEVINLYKERRQLLRALSLQPERGRAHYMRLLRLEELTVYLNTICNGRLPPINATEAYLSGSW